MRTFKIVPFDRPAAVLSEAALLTSRRIPAFPRRHTRWLSSDRLLATTLAASILLHIVVLAVKFRPFDFDRKSRQAPALEVALVNAKSPEAPVKADVLAQAKLDGGGNTDAKRQARSPLPVMPKAQPSPQPTMLPTPLPATEPTAQAAAPASQPVTQPVTETEATTRKLEALERETKELLTQLTSPRQVMVEPRPVEVKPVDAPPEKVPDPQAARDPVPRAAEVIRLEAQIAKDFEAYQQRPKRRFIGARAEEYRFARYVEDWRMKVERIGNLNYPEAARQQKLYGSLLVTVSIKSDGSVESVEINRSSGRKVLDAAVTRIIELAAPYSAFPADIKRDTDVLHITRTWTFTRSDSLLAN